MRIRKLFYKIKENKHIITPITILIFSFIVFAGGLTYAYFDFAIERSDVSSLKVTGADFDILVIGTGINSDNDMPIYDEYKDSQSNKYNFTVKNNSEKMNACYSVSFLVSSISEYLRDENFKWEIVDNTNSLVQSGNFLGVTPSTKIPLFADRNLEKDQMITYTLKLWLSHSETVNQISALGGNIQGKIVVEATGEFCSELATARFEYLGAPQPYVVPANGIYRVQLWGAQGGNSSSRGAYTEGKIVLTKGTKLYINVGGNISTTNSISYNGGQSTGGSYAGGGATDLRITGGSWSDINGLNSRIMVAAGGGSGNSIALNGAAGGLIGYSGGAGNTGGTQTAPGTQTAFQLTNFPAFGIAGGGCTGGNGYYPGGGGNCSDGAGGGSSYISGHAGCIAIAQGNETIPSRSIKSGCNASSTSVSCSTHYSGYNFYDTKMIDGAGYSWTTIKGAQEAMPNPNGEIYPTGEGNSGNGYAKITLLDLDQYRSLIENGDFASNYYQALNSIAWDTSLNPNPPLRATKWSSGYNSGVASPATGYHAHFEKTTFGYPVINFTNMGSSYRRWQGVYQSIVAGTIQPNKTYLITMNIYSNTVGTKNHGGIHYYDTEAELWRFAGGQFIFTSTSSEINEWVTKSWLTTTPSTLSIEESTNLYIYGHTGESGKAYIKDVSLIEL